MHPLTRPSTFSAAGITSWMLHLAARMLACSLNMPAPLLHNTGVFVVAQVQAVETKAAKRFVRFACCAIAKAGSVRRRADPFPRPPHRKGELP
jgi:hypothetical protein